MEDIKEPKENSLLKLEDKQIKKIYYLSYATNYILIFLSILFLYGNGTTILYSINHYIGVLGSIVMCFFMFISGISIYFAWYRKKIGWILSIIHFGILLTEFPIGTVFGAIGATVLVLGRELFNENFNHNDIVIEYNNRFKNNKVQTGI